MITTVQCSICSQLNNKPRVQCCQVSVFYRNFTDLLWLSSRSMPLGYKRTERGTPSQPCITSPFKQQTISQSCSHHFLRSIITEIYNANTEARYCYLAALRVVFTYFRMHHTCSVIILWLHSLSGVIRSLLCNSRAFSPAIIIKSTEVQTLSTI